METIDFVDPHVHLIDLDRLHYPWLSPPFSHDAALGSTEAIARAYSLSSYLKDMQGLRVRGLVHVDSGVAADEILSEVRYASQILQTALAPPAGVPQRLDAAAIVGCAQLNSLDLDQILTQHKSTPLFRGVRHIVNWHKYRAIAYPGPDLTRDPAWLNGLAVLARHGLTFDLQCFPDQMPALASVFQHHGNMPVVIDHLGMPLFDMDGGQETWRRGMRALASCPNVHVKLSGYGFISRNWQFEDVAPVLTEVIDLFGVGRCMFASDFPTDLLFAPARQTIETWLRFVEPFSTDEKRALLGGTAARFYRMDLCS
ncbi:amidohydrolase family protein [Asaia sp. HN010]|uniref:amidohydrolase family protein n=1 Tax=Asaia sp. HN010 TaxID=3081233 RepID=UPI003015F913